MDGKPSSAGLLGALGQAEPKLVVLSAGSHHRPSLGLQLPDVPLMVVAVFMWPCIPVSPPELPPKLGLVPSGWIQGHATDLPVEPFQIFWGQTVRDWVRAQALLGPAEQILGLYPPWEPRQPPGIRPVFSIPI